MTWRRHAGVGFARRLPARVSGGAPAVDTSPLELVVTNTNDSGPGSLRAAIDTANGTSAARHVTITFALSPGATITLTSGQLKLLRSMDIVGPGVADLEVNGNASSRVFYLYSGAPTQQVSTISGLTIANGAIAMGGGGGLVNWNFDLTLDTVNVTGNQALPSGTNGGGVKNWSDLHMLDCEVTGNTAYGGGGVQTASYDTVLIEDCVISGNVATDQVGGGMGIGASAPGTVTIRRTTIADNEATLNAGGGVSIGNNNHGAVSIDACAITGNTAARGGGAQIVGGPTALLNTTVSGNHATAAGGGGVKLYLNAGGDTHTIDLSTIAANDAATVGGGVEVVAGAHVTVRNSIIGDNAAPADPDVHGTMHADYTLIENVGAATIIGAHNVTCSDPQLGALANNGGPTETQLPAPTSPAVDAGDPGFTPPPTTDQRGLPRVVGGALDMGSVERQ